MQMDKGKEVVPPLEKSKEVVPPLVEVPVQDPPSAKRRNYGHYHQESGPNHFCKVILAPKLESLPLPLDFTKHFPTIPTEFKMKTNIGYMLPFKLLSPDTMKVIVFNDEGVEVVTKCKEHDNRLSSCCPFLVGCWFKTWVSFKTYLTMLV